ncbi:MAG: CopG family transcriptional regulator [Deltaproteobacteria bacterium]|nr:CopG family transcriptional regulator [Deltaproteobacteria bacterium]
MSQVTIYMDDETEAKAKAAAQEAGVSLSRWIAGVLKSRVATTWPADVAGLAGSWRSGGDGSDFGQAEGTDLPREQL